MDFISAGAAHGHRDVLSGHGPLDPARDKPVHRRRTLHATFLQAIRTRVRQPAPAGPVNEGVVPEGRPGVASVQPFGPSSSS